MLPGNYYLSNFDALTNFVVETYREILTADELLWATTVQALPEHARRLYVRLLSRRGTLFRLGKLKYPEIDNTVGALQTLVDTDLACVEAPAELDGLLPLLTRGELMRLPELSDAKGLSRRELDERLRVLDSPRVLGDLQALDHWIELRQRELFELFVMCYFGNRYQDLSEFVIRDLGHLRFEAYSIDKNTRPFQTRLQIDAHWNFFHVLAASESVDTSSRSAILALDAQLPDVHGHRVLAEDAHLVRRVGRLRNQLARQLERLQFEDEALALYERSELPPSRERQVRILAGGERFEEALSLATRMLLTPIDDSESRFAERQVPALKRKTGQRTARTRAFRPATTKLTLQTCDENVSDRVEWRALEYYQRSGRCYYSENALLKGVLGLFIWDIMFLPVDGAFHHPFQAGPSDLMQPEFRSKRQQAFARRWEDLDDPLRLSARVWHHWEEKRGLSNQLVHWSRLSEELLSDALIRIPVGHWRVLFERLLSDLRHNGKGLPDLALFPDRGGYEFIEIKGPGDALQQHQRRWMQYFTEHGIPHRVVNIRFAQQERNA